MTLDEIQAEADTLKPFEVPTGREEPQEGRKCLAFALDSGKLCQIYVDYSESEIAIYTKRKMQDGVFFSLEEARRLKSALEMLLA
jgi:hypothetical protein